MATAEIGADADGGPRRGPRKGQPRRRRKRSLRQQCDDEHEGLVELATVGRVERHLAAEGRPRRLHLDDCDPSATQRPHLALEAQRARFRRARPRSRATPQARPGGQSWPRPSRPAHAPRCTSPRPPPASMPARPPEGHSRRERTPGERSASTEAGPAPVARAKERTVARDGRPSAYDAGHGVPRFRRHHPGPRRQPRTSFERRRAHRNAGTTKSLRRSLFARRQARRGWHGDRARVPRPPHRARRRPQEGPRRARVACGPRRSVSARSVRSGSARAPGHRSGVRPGTRSGRKRLLHDEAPARRDVRADLRRAPRGRRARGPAVLAAQAADRVRERLPGASLRARARRDSPRPEAGQRDAR